MATASRSIARIAEVTGILPATVFRAARFLREADGGLWPQGSQGRGREAHVEPHHLVNLILALGIADPITTAPFAVTSYRALPHFMLQITDEMADGLSQKSRLPVRQGMLEPLLHMFGTTLGDRLDGLISTLQASQNRMVRDLFRASIFNLKLTAAFVPQASISLTRCIETGKRTEADIYQAAQAVDDMEVAGEIKRDVTVPFAVFDAMIDLWSDTQLHHASKKPSRKRRSRIPNGPASAPKSKTAASPGREAAALDDQTAQTELDGHSHSHPMDERDKVQSSSQSRPGHPHEHLWSDPDEKVGNGGANLFAA